MRSAFRTFSWVFPRHDHFAAILAIPHRDSVPPPQLPADAPVLDVIHPTQENFREAIRHKCNLSLAHRFRCHCGQAIHVHKPLRRHQRFHDLPTPLRPGNIHQVRLFLQHQACLCHIFPDGFAGFETLHTGVFAGIFVQCRIFVHNVDQSQVVALTNFIVMRVMPRGYLERASAKVLGHILVCHHRDFPAQDWDNHFFTHKPRIAFILRVHCHGCITRNGFRTGGCNRDVIPATIRQNVFEVVELALFLGIFHFQVRDSRLQAGRPVDHAWTLIN